jgi:O-antigen ligase
MIEDLIDFIEIHPIVAFEAIYEQVPSKLKKNRMHFYSIQVHSSFLIQVSCMVYTIKKLEFKKLEWRLVSKIRLVHTGYIIPKVTISNSRSD